MKQHEKKMKKAEARARLAKETMIIPGGTGVGKTEFKEIQLTQAKALKKLSKGMEGLLLVMSPEQAFKTVALIKDAGISDLFVALGESAELLEHLRRGKK